PRIIQVQPEDNVAIVVNAGGLRPGTVLENGLTLLDHVPQGHKVALAEIQKGEPIRRYGAVIGYATEVIPQGAVVSEARIEMPEPPALDHLPL
ncbi:UxaA family hydrolase, partial [Acinetobacter baumannii]